jgi:hypothetical protein
VTDDWNMDDHAQAQRDGYRDAVTTQARRNTHGHDLATYLAIRERYERAISPWATPGQQAYAAAFDHASVVFEAARRDGPRSHKEAL